MLIKNLRKEGTCGLPVDEGMISEPELPQAISGVNILNHFGSVKTKNVTYLSEIT